jgi:membrane dipeptidase
VIVDAHNDLLLELVQRRDEKRPFERFWLPQLEQGGIGLQVCPIYASDAESSEAALRKSLLAAAAFQRALAERPDRLAVVETAQDLDRLDGRIGLVLALEGVEALGREPALIDAFWHLGVRMVGLTWNRRNAFADGLAEEDDRGLSELGGRLVDRLAELGAMLDLAHASPQTFADVLERAPDAAVLVSHACCRAVSATPRNLSDDQLDAVAARDGVVGIMGLPLTVDPREPTLDRLVDHVDHAVAVMGIEHVGLGADFVRQIFRAARVTSVSSSLMPPGMAPDAVVEGFEGPQHYPSLVETLRRRGYEGERLDAILAGNLLRLFRRALPSA